MSNRETTKAKSMRIKRFFKRVAKVMYYALTVVASLASIVGLTLMLVA